MVRSCCRELIVVLLPGVSKIRHLFISMSVTKKIKLGHGNSFLREYDFITVKSFVPWVIL